MFDEARNLRCVMKSPQWLHLRPAEAGTIRTVALCFRHDHVATYWATPRSYSSSRFMRSWDSDGATSSVSSGCRCSSRNDRPSKITEHQYARVVKSVSQ